ncbi:ATP-binding protein [Pseudonocardia xinjiangensis]|uniref:ATP-binding protein n=1 Tax=Pseudonocardia xinjiangensis TaxID=75289 RepID=UPI003D8B1D59
MLDRSAEREVLDRLLQAVRSGESRALVMHGEPGVGKTALLEYVVERAPGRVVRAAGVQSEIELAFAGLHQLCAPLLDGLARLPDHQRHALGTALGLRGGPPPDRFLVGLAVLDLLAEEARERPLVCVVDDAHWLDRASAQALAFVARRLVAESVGIVFAIQATDGCTALTGLAELVVDGLPDDDARALLRSVLRGPVDERVLGRIVAETRGIPLALIELPRGLAPAELAGGFGPTAGAALPMQIEDSFRRQLMALEADARRLLLIAAAEPLGEPVLVWRAAERLGVGVDAAVPAVAAGLLEIGAGVRFRHPLERSAVYRAASPQERRSVHRALAEATCPETDPDRRAWHAAQATVEPEEQVAVDLERSAGRAQARGGPAAAAAFLQRAAELTPDPTRRGERALSAAQAAHQAGMPDAALRLLSIADAGPADNLQRAYADLLRARIAFDVNRGRAAVSSLLEAARKLGSLDVRLARETYLDALSAAILAGPLVTGGSVREVAEAARAAPPAAQPPSAADLLLDALATRYTAGYAASTPMLRRALDAFRSNRLGQEDELRWLWQAHIVAVNLWDDEALEMLVSRHVQLARDTGALTTLPLALNSRITVHVLMGEMAAAAALIQELEAVTEVTDSSAVPYGALLLAAWRGREAEAAQVIETTLAEVVRRGEGIGLTVTVRAKALLLNSLGRYQDALTAAQQSNAHLAELGLSAWGVLVELIEAAIRSGMPAHAADALTRLAETTPARGSDWASGIEARCRAVLSAGADAESLYRAAIDRLGRTRIRGELARGHLLYGEWLRRERRRVDARQQLRSAHEMFSAMGMEAFAQRAARELQATGERVRKRAVETGGELTAQEAQIVRLVREGLSNPEIAARLFLSPRTIEWHLSKIFGKLNITSRMQLFR